MGLNINHALLNYAELIEIRPILNVVSDDVTGFLNGIEIKSLTDNRLMRCVSSELNEPTLSKLGFYFAYIEKEYNSQPKKGLNIDADRTALIDGVLCTYASSPSKVWLEKNPTEEQNIAHVVLDQNSWAGYERKRFIIQLDEHTSLIDVDKLVRFFATVLWSFLNT